MNKIPVILFITIVGLILIICGLGSFHRAKIDNLHKLISQQESLNEDLYHQLNQCRILYRGL